MKSVLYTKPVQQIYYSGNPVRVGVAFIFKICRYLIAVANINPLVVNTQPIFFFFFGLTRVVFV